MGKTYICCFMYLVADKIKVILLYRGEKELKSLGASKLLSNLVQADIIEPVSGYGKGKYKFKK